MNLQPLEDRIVVRPAEAEETTVSGLVIPDTAKEKPQQGEVLAVGPGRRSEQTRRAHPRRRRGGRRRPLLEVRRHRGHRRRRGPARSLEPATSWPRSPAARRSSPGDPRSWGPGRPPAHPEAGDGAGGRGGALGPSPARGEDDHGSTGSGNAWPGTPHPRSRPCTPVAGPRRSSSRCSRKRSEARLVLTRRPETMPSHRGEIAFPGGKVEAGVDHAPRSTPRSARPRRRSVSDGRPSTSSPPSRRSAPWWGSS